MNQIRLNHKVTFYVPSTTAKDKAITLEDFNKRTEKIADTLTRYFGGATIEQAKGFYKDKSNNYITEDINKVVSFCSDNQLSDNLQNLLNLANNKAKQWEQETIGIEIDNSFLLLG